MASMNRNEALASSLSKVSIDSKRTGSIIGTKKPQCRESVDNWPDWKKRAALSNYQFSK